MELVYTGRFLRSFKKLSEDLQIDCIRAIELYKKDTKNVSLKVHTLAGQLKIYDAFSINYSHRVIIKKTKTISYCMDVGDHSMYNRFK